jgi:hypothetical protein
VPQRRLGLVCTSKFRFFDRRCYLVDAEISPLTSFHLTRSPRNFTGFDAEGINRETAAFLENGALSRLRKIPSLSVSKASIVLHAIDLSSPGSGAAPLSARKMALASGILPALGFLTHEDTRSFKKDVPAVPKRISRRRIDNPGRLSASPVASPIKAAKDELAFKGDYSCEICGQELYNTYFRRVRKGSKNQDICRQCRSHTTGDFNARKRLIDDDAGMKGLLAKIEAMVGEKSVEYAEETVLRLKFVANPDDAGLKEEVALLLKKHRAVRAARAAPEMVDAFSSFIKLARLDELRMHDVE